jgi:hypothetical protein
MAAPKILDERMPGDHNPSVAALREPTHRSQPRLQLPMACWRTGGAAVTSRRGDTNTSMTCPDWSIARYT